MNDCALLMVAEDDPDDQYFFQEAIEVVRPRDVEAHFVMDGMQLLKLLREKMQQRYRRRLVVLDLEMQVKNGRSTLQELKSDPAFAHIPVVILTTSGAEEDMEYCRRAGAARYFRKPSSIVDLVAIVRELQREYL